jgi:hypothetical protein
MDDDSVLLTMQALSADLASMSDAFVRLIKSSKMDVGTGVGLHGGASFDVHAESLVASSSAALAKVTALRKAIILGDADRGLYEKVRKSQFKLCKVRDKFKEQMNCTGFGASLEIQKITAAIEEHLYSSKVRPVPHPESKTSDDSLNELCSEALHAYLQRPGGDGA